MAALLVTAVGLMLAVPPALADDFGKYGVSRGDGSEGANGTAVLAAMLREMGHTVVRSDLWRPTTTAGVDTIVWFRQDAALPDEHDWEILRDWLADRPERMVLLVGRDYAADRDLLEGLAAAARPGDRLDARRRLARYRLEHTEPAADPPDLDAPDAGQPFRWVTTGTDPAKAEMIESAREATDFAQLELAAAAAALPHPHTIAVGPWTDDYQARPLLIVEEPFAVWYEPDDWSGPVVVIDNASFLLNASLVDPDNRRLVAALFGERPYDSGDGPRRILLLEQPVGELKVEPRPPSLPGGLSFLTTWPIGPVLIHLAVLGIAACAAAAAIFGRARRGKAESRSDFAEHLYAVGRQLRSTGDVDFARSRIRQYHQHVKKTASGLPPERSA